MTKRTRLLNYLLYGLFSVILEKSTIRTPEVIFHIRLGAQKVIRGRRSLNRNEPGDATQFLFLSLLRQGLGQI